MFAQLHLAHCWQSAWRLLALSLVAPIARFLATCAQPVLAIVLMFAYWSHPLAVFQEGRLWPLARAYAVPSFASGSLGVVAWHFLCARGVGNLTASLLKR